MPTGRVIEPNEVFLNGHAFPITGGVLRRPVNEFAEKTVIGDYTEASDPVLSAVTQEDWRGGMGRHVFNLKDPEHSFQFWDGNVNNAFSGHAFPQRDIFATPGFFSDSLVNHRALFHAEYADSGATSPGFYIAVSENNGASYSIHEHVLTSTLVRHNPASEPTDMKSGQVGTFKVLAVAQNERISWTRNDVTDTNWSTDSSENIKFVAFMRDLMFGLNASGELFFTPDASSSTITWSRLTQADVTSTGVATGLVVSNVRVPGIELRNNLFLLRQDGFDVYNNATEQFDPVLRLPSSSNAGKAGHGWNGSFLYSYGLSLIRWTPSPAGNVVESIGLDERDGLPTEYNGWIQSINATPRQLFVSVTSNDSTQQPAVYVRGQVMGWSRFAEPQGGTSTNAKAFGHIHIGRTSFDDLFLVPGWVNPDSVGVYNRFPSYQLRTVGENIALAGGEFTDGHLITPWIVADANQDWVAHKVSADVSLITGAGSATSSFFVDYGTDFNDSAWTTAISVSKANTDLYQALLEQPLPNSKEPVGKPFRAFRFRVRWENTDDFTSFDLNRLSLVFEKRPKLRYMFTFDIDLTKEHKGDSPKQLREFIDEFLIQNTLGEFAYSDEHPGGDRTYYVRPINPASQERTGQVESTRIRMNVLEVA